MNEASNWLVHDHKKYDMSLAQCEEIAEEGAWEEAAALFYTFVDDLKLHMQMEDEVLYPLYEEQYGDPEGVISYLNAEHNNLVRLLNDLAYVIQRGDFEHFEVSLRPLHRAMNEHNMHEEEVFLNMEDDSLLLRRDEILQRLKAMHKHDHARAWDF